MSATQRILILDLDHLKQVVHEHIEQFGPQCDLNHLDISKVTDLESLFVRSNFNGDVSRWDTSSVTNMSSVFATTPFTGDVSKWDTSKVTRMSRMFASTPFNGDIYEWDTSNVTHMDAMFSSCLFNGDISQWDVSQVTNMSYMFCRSSFQGNISRWNTQNVVFMREMFEHSSFNGDVSKWSIHPHAMVDFAVTPSLSSPLGLMCMLEWEGALPVDNAVPEDRERAARFHEVRGVVEALGLKGRKAAEYIWEHLEANQGTSPVISSLQDFSH